jgi:lipid A ethanolaminephosphotransferase
MRVGVGGPAFRVLLSVVGIGLLASLFWRPVLNVTIDPSAIRFDGGYRYSFDVSGLEIPGYRLLDDDARYFPMRSELVLMRDGLPLGPAHESPEVLQRQLAGNGAFSHSKGMLYFSTPGNSDPRYDGHHYSFRARLALGPSMAAVLAGSIFSVVTILVLSFAQWREHVRRVGWKHVTTPLKLLALGVLLAALPNEVGHQSEILYANGQFNLLISYLGITIVSLLGILAVPFLHSFWMRMPLAVIIVAGFLVDRIIMILYGQHPTMEMIQTLWRERSIGGGVILAYQDTVLSSLAVASLLALLLLLPPAGRWRFGSRFSIFPLSAFTCIALCIYVTSGAVAAFPGSLAVPAQFAVVQSQPIPATRLFSRLPVDYAGPIRPLARKVIMVVDESVRGDYLGLNNPRYDNTPFLRQSADKLANYGVAVSIANCSEGSRVVLRLGLQKEQMPDLTQTWARVPTLWQYAHEAGFRTAIIDGWQKDRPFHSWLTQPEAALIDLKYYPGNESPYLRDAVVADKLIELLHRDEPLFIYVNKYGTHVPYWIDYPPDIKYDPSPLVQELPLNQQRRNVVEQYHKALRWSVDSFFEKVIPEVLKQPDATLIYTSDHGQALYEGGYDAPQCSMSPNFSQGEVSVPLFVATGASDLETLFATEAHRAFNRAHHFQIFPTLLELMGYQRSWIAPHYGAGLLNVPIEQQRSSFIGGVFSAPGARWIPYPESQSVHMKIPRELESESGYYVDGGLGVAPAPTAAAR